MTDLALQDDAIRTQDVPSRAKMLARLRLGDLGGGHLHGKYITLFGAALVSVFCRQEEPHVRLDQILGHSLRLCIHFPEVRKRRHIALLCRPIKPK